MEGTGAYPEKGLTREGNPQKPKMQTFPKVISHGDVRKTNIPRYSTEKILRILRSLQKYIQSDRKYTENGYVTAMLKCCMGD